MTIDLSTLNLAFALLCIHFIADFALQSDEMAVNKSGSNWWLSFHVGTYAAVLLACTGQLRFALVNGVFHWVTDWFTSRGTAYLWRKERRHDFFVLIGFDQLIHVSTLLFTTYWLIS